MQWLIWKESSKTDEDSIDVALKVLERKHVITQNKNSAVKVS